MRGKISHDFGPPGRRAPEGSHAPRHVIGGSGAGKSTLARSPGQGSGAAGRTREGIPEGCPERVDAEFLKFVWNFQTRYRPQIVAALEKFAGQTLLHRLESRNDAG